MWTYQSKPLGRLVVLMCMEGVVSTAGNFCLWLKVYVQPISNRNAEKDRMLLLYDEYYPHMSFCFLKILYKNRFVVYAIPAHAP